LITPKKQKKLNIGTSTCTISRTHKPIIEKCEMFERIRKKPVETSTKLTDDWFKKNGSTNKSVLPSKRQVFSIRKVVYPLAFFILLIHLVVYVILLFHVMKRMDVVEQDAAELKRILHAKGGSQARSRAQSQSRAIMIIAVYPKSIDRIGAIWSQLECFSHDYEKIVIVSLGGESQMDESLLKLMNEISIEMPEIASKIETRVFAQNEKRDTGLWCDYLIKDDILQKGLDGTYLGGSAGVFDNFLLINDSVMAVENSNELLDTLHAKKLSMVSLNFWNENTDEKIPFWVESVARVFSLEGIQTYADEVCSKMNNIQWRKDCPDLMKFETWPNLVRLKKCIVRKTEVEIASLYSPSKVLGLYPGKVPENLIQNERFYRSPSWTSHYTYWALTLRQKMNFPALKVTNEDFLNYVIKKRPRDIRTCTLRMGKGMLDIAAGISESVNTDKTCETFPNTYICNLKSRL